ncbi:hypothetical protein [Nostoc sp. ChiQUE01b]|uniref:hypothetical protein n=1 Tax=Nostoc sp. ChiQUE01b TaxID=3075376 RepID=UPI002AD440F8|nr:hypothetical protein [Nostoc sp. ChiQUE01b]MDZ8259847.1 hypothetical protein [Nostoc sp. ChiQUE01b]
MTFFESNESNFFEIDGIHLRIWEPNLIVLPIPENRSDSSISVEIVEIKVYLINNTPNPCHLNPNQTLIPELLTSDGQVLQGQITLDEAVDELQRNIPPQAAFGIWLRQFVSNLAQWLKRSETIVFAPRLINSGLRIPLTLALRLIWQNNHLQLQVINSPNSLSKVFRFLDKTWFFNIPQPESYQLRFIWGNYGESESSLDPPTEETVSAVQLATQFVNLRLIEPVVSHNSAIEVDGIHFETLMPERVLILPEKKRGIKTRMELGICITNNTSTAVRFSLFATIIPQLVGADGQLHFQGYYRRGTKRPSESDFPLVMPGESFTLFPYSELSWRKLDPFTLIIEAGDGGYWNLDGLKAGIYQIQLAYNNKYTVQEIEIYDRESLNTNLIEGLWIGMVSTPKIEFRLV